MNSYPICAVLPTPALPPSLKPCSVLPPLLMIPHFSPSSALLPISYFTFDLLLLRVFSRLRPVCCSQDSEYSRQACLPVVWLGVGLELGKELCFLLLLSLLPALCSSQFLS